MIARNAEPMAFTAVYDIAGRTIQISGIDTHIVQLPPCKSPKILFRHPLAHPHNFKTDEARVIRVSQLT